LFGGFSMVLFISGAEKIGDAGRILQEKGLWFWVLLMYQHIKPVPLAPMRDCTRKT
jgi:hypothetical protein